MLFAIAFKTGQCVLN